MASSLISLSVACVFSNSSLEFEIVKATEYVPKEAYTYRSEHDFATLYLDPDNHTFSLSLSVLSSYWPHGRYTEKSGYIICKAADNTGNTYTFRREKDSLVFVAVRSSEIPQWSSSDRKTIGVVLDGAVFVVLFLLYSLVILYSSPCGCMVNPPIGHRIQTLIPWVCGILKNRGR